MMNWPRKCRLCGEAFSSEDAFTDHLKKHISELTFIEQQKDIMAPVKKGGKG